MENISYKRTANGSYMCIVGRELTGHEARMLERNEIESFLPFYTTMSDGEPLYWYDISGKRALRDYLLNRGISVDTLYDIFEQLSISLKGAGKFLIQENHISLDPDMIFVEEKKGNIKIYLCYNSDDKDGSNSDNLAEFLIQNVDHDKPDAEKLCYEIYDMVVSNGATIEEVAEFIREERYIADNSDSQRYMKSEFEMTDSPQTTAHGNRPYDSVQIDSANWDNRCVQIHAKGEVAVEPALHEPDEPPKGFFSVLLEKIRGILPTMQPIIKKADRMFPKNDPMDLIYEPKPVEYEPTVVIGAITQGVSVGRLIYEGNRDEKDFEISEACFMIGSGNTNHAVIHSNTVSREHACIRKDGDEYFIEDMNSTNGTYLNGELLAYKMPVRLRASDRLRFADVPYRFSVEPGKISG